MKFSNVD